MSEVYKHLPVHGFSDEFVEEDGSGEKSLRVSGNLTISETVGTIATIVNINVALAGVEESFTLPDNTTRFSINIREIDTDMNLSYTSSGDYIKIKRGVTYSEDKLKTNSVTLYFTTNKDNKTVELVYWI